MFKLRGMAFAPLILAARQLRTPFNMEVRVHAKAQPAGLRVALTWKSPEDPLFGYQGLSGRFYVNAPCTTKHDVRVGDWHGTGAM